MYFFHRELVLSIFSPLLDGETTFFPLIMRQCYQVNKSQHAPGYLIMFLNHIQMTFALLSTYFPGKLWVLMICKITLILNAMRELPS